MIYCRGDADLAWEVRGGFLEEETSDLRFLSITGEGLKRMRRRVGKCSKDKGKSCKGPGVGGSISVRWAVVVSRIT